MSDGADFGFAPSGSVPDDRPVYVISVAATLAGMHPQTLRQYDRLGLVSPDRTDGGLPRASATLVQGGSGTAPPGAAVATQHVTSRCCGRCSACRRTKASTSPA